MKTAIDSADEDTRATSDLLARARDGDRQAFERLYQRHHRRVQALSLRLTRDGADAEALTQETFVRAWQGLAGFRGESRLGTWLHAITVRAHLERQRRDGTIARREIRQEDEATYLFAARRAMPETDIDLERAIARLPLGARRVLVLHDIHGYKHREIGAMLDVSETTSKTQLHRARKLVRALLEGDEAGSSRPKEQTREQR